MMAVSYHEKSIKKDAARAFNFEDGDAVRISALSTPTPATTAVHLPCLNKKPSSA